MVDFKAAKYIANSEMPKIIIYGRNGIGKSRFAMNAPSPIFLDLDRNIGQYKVITNKSSGIDCPLDTFQQVLDFLSLLINEPHDFKTIVIDSLSSLDLLIENQVKKENNVPAVSAIPYGKGNDLVKNLWKQFQQKLEILWSKRHMMIILIGHNSIKGKKDLVNGNHDMYKLAIEEKSAEILNNWSSAILYATDHLNFKEEITGFGKVNKTVQNSKKVLCTCDGVISLAKNTYNLPHFIPFDDVTEAWNIFSTHVFPKPNQETKSEAPIKGEK